MAGSSSSSSVTGGSQPVTVVGRHGRSGCLFLFGLIFFGAGVGIFGFLIIPTILEWQSADEWAAAEATITQSTVGEHSDSDGTTYSINLKYHYDVDGERHWGDRYTFMDFQSSDRGYFQDLAATYRVGTTHTIYYNPEDPAAAVINRTLDWTFWIMWLFLLFPIIGGAMMARSLLGASGKMSDLSYLPPTPSVKATRRQVRNLRDPRSISDNATAPGAVQLRLTKNRAGSGIAGMLFGGVFLGVGIFVAGQPDAPAWFGWIFAGVGGLIVLFGLGMFIVSFAPRPRLFLPRASVTPGEKVVLTWDWSRPTRAAKNLSISLIGEEQTKYRRGTNTVTDKNEFYEQELLATVDPTEIAGGTLELVVPAEQMHTLVAYNNKVQWRLRVKTAVSDWLSRTDDVELVVRPTHTETTYERPRRATLRMARGRSEKAKQTIAGADRVESVSHTQLPAHANDATPMAITLDRPSSEYQAEPVYPPEQPLIAWLSWQFESEPPEKLDVRLYWQTFGKGSNDVSVERRETIEAPGREGTRKVTFRLPEGPYTAHGSLISIRWGAELVAMGVSEFAVREPFILSPHDGPVHLTAPAPEAE